MELLPRNPVDPTLDPSALRDVEAVPVLVELLEDADGNVRSGAAFILSEIGPKAKAAIRPLVRLLSDDSPRVRQNAVRAIFTMHNNLDELLPLFKDSDKRVRLGMVILYGSFSADEIDPDVREALNDPDREVRDKAAEFVRCIEERKGNVPMRN